MDRDGGQRKSWICAPLWTSMPETQETRRRCPNELPLEANRAETRRAEQVMLALNAARLGTGTAAGKAVGFGQSWIANV